MCTLPNISRNKDNQAVKFDQFIEYNMKNIFLEKSHKIWCRNWSENFWKSQN